MSDSSRTVFRHVQSKERESLSRRARKTPLSAHFWPANWPVVGRRQHSTTVYQAQRGFHSTPLLSLRVPAPSTICRYQRSKTEKPKALPRTSVAMQLPPLPPKLNFFNVLDVHGHESIGSFLHWSPREQKELLCPKYYSAYIIFTHLILTMVIWNLFNWWGNWSTNKLFPKVTLYEEY